MTNQVFNPFLPLDVCIPDGEPHVFGDRLYLFGSHETPGGDRFCNRDYEFYSAPVSDLTNWSSRGINYRTSQDPDYGETFDAMYAPDVVQGKDKRFYLYYAMSGKAFTGNIHVAVSDTPDGQYEFYGEVRNKDGSPFKGNITFDPAVINDDGVIRLYYGWSLAIDEEKAKEIAGKGEEELYPVYQMLFGKTPEQVKAENGGLMGAFTVVLDEDMLTVNSKALRVAPGQFDSFGTEFEGHAFFEGSSIRKINGKYYFIYSSEKQHELCYATSAYPDRGFSFGGVIISNGDIGYDGRNEQARIAATGNNHGSIECIESQWYIFYHRQTHKQCFSRQACAEKISLLSDGSIPQVKMTGCGLNKGPIKASGSISSAYCCGLTNGHMEHLEPNKPAGNIPYLTYDGSKWFATDITDETYLIFRNFEFNGKTRLKVVFRGGAGEITAVAGKIKEKKRIDSTRDWTECLFEFELKGTEELKILYSGNEKIDISELIFD